MKFEPKKYALPSLTNDVVEKRFRTMFDSAPIGMVVRDLDGVAARFHGASQSFPQGAVILDQQQMFQIVGH